MVLHTGSGGTERLRHEDCCKSEDSLGYVQGISRQGFTRPCLLEKKKKKNQKILKMCSQVSPLNKTEIPSDLCQESTDFLLKEPDSNTLGYVGTQCLLHIHC